MKRFHSKVSLGLVLFLSIPLGFGLIESWKEAAYVGIIVISLCWFFCLHLLFTTHYTIEGDLLKIQAGFIYRKAIPIATIRNIEPTHSILSAPAASLLRLEIKYNTMDSVLVSPKDQTEFIHALREQNAAITSSIC